MKAEKIRDLEPCPCGRYCPTAECNYYVSVVDGPRFGLLAGPFATHAQALAWSKLAGDLAVKLNHWAWFYSYGTVAMRSTYDTPGILNRELGLST